jgi:ornithine cyclodeaminase
MQVYGNDDVAALITIDEAIDTLRQAFIDFAGDAGAMLSRQRCGTAQATLSAMGAVLPKWGVASAKVYTTVRGQFNFVTVLYSIHDNSLLAVLEGDALTRFRTSAVTALAAERLASPDADTLAIFGTGVQASAHVHALVRVRPIKRVYVVGIEGTDVFARHIRDSYGIAAEVTNAEHAVEQAGLIVTATRAGEPLFDGNDLKPGAFVAAIGSSKPTTREIDDATLRRAGFIVVEWRPQAKAEAGDLLMAAPGIFEWDAVQELGDILLPTWRDVRPPGTISLYKSVGVGLEDLALAALVHRKASARATATVPAA